MGKRIKNPVQILLEKSGDEVTCSLHYGLECEHGSLGRQVFEPALTPNEEQEARQLMDWAMTKINEHEEI